MTYPNAWVKVGGLFYLFLKLYSSSYYSQNKDLIKSYVLPHMQTLDQGQTQQGDWTLST
jgi:hypothetical protein